MEFAIDIPIIWLIIIFSFAVYYNNLGFSPHGHTSNIYYFFNKGVLRGLAGIGIGYFINMLFSTDFLKNCSYKAKVLISLSEIGIVTFFCGYMFFTSKLPGKSAFVLVVMFSILFFLFLRKQGILSRILENNLSVILGGASYAIYVMHPIVRIYFKYLIYKPNKEYFIHHALIYISIMFIVAVIVGFIVHYFVENKINRYVKEKLKG